MLNRKSFLYIEPRELFQIMMAPNFSEAFQALKNNDSLNQNMYLGKIVGQPASYIDRQNIQNALSFPYPYKRRLQKLVVVHKSKYCCMYDFVNLVYQNPTLEFNWKIGNYSYFTIQEKTFTHSLDLAKPWLNNKNTAKP